ncbi:MAG: hypothetical protein OER21_01675, partial [Gemmatimonadota bacterium]|nr:hypothetical protein [Gemmatimonadota bacterium]
MRLGYKMVLGTALLVTGTLACPDDTPIFLSGPPGPAASLKVSNSAIELTVGRSAVIGAAVQDDVGNVTGDAVTMTACDGAVVSVAPNAAASGAPWSAEATVTGAGLGVSCVVVSGGGFTDTIRVKTGPAGMRVLGDPLVGYDPPDDVGPYSYSVEAVDAAGTVLTGTTAYEWSSANRNVFSVDKATGEVIGRGPGIANIQVRAPGGANAVMSLDVGLPGFQGTASTTSGGQGDLITLTRTAGPDIDGNTTPWLAFGNVRAFIDGTPSASSLRLAIPATNTAAG